MWSSYFWLYHFPLILQIVSQNKPHCDLMIDFNTVLARRPLQTMSSQSKGYYFAWCHCRKREYFETKKNARNRRHCFGDPKHWSQILPSFRAIGWNPREMELENEVVLRLLSVWEKRRQIHRFRKGISTLPHRRRSRSAVRLGISGLLVNQVLCDKRGKIHEYSNKSDRLLGPRDPVLSQHCIPARLRAFYQSIDPKIVHKNPVA